MNETPVLCPHGRVTAWNGWARPGDRLPDIEHCEVCDPDAHLLDDAE